MSECKTLQSQFCNQNISLHIKERFTAASIYYPRSVSQMCRTKMIVLSFLVGFRVFEMETIVPMMLEELLKEAMFVVFIL